MAQTTTGPSYYQRGSIQVWDFIRDQRLNFHLGNAIKYICRYGHKGDYNSQVSDLKKAIHYLNDELNNLERSRNREDLPRSTSFFPDGGSSTVSGGLSSEEMFIGPSPIQAAQPYNGGVQGVSGGGSDVLSFEPIK